MYAPNPPPKDNGAVIDQPKHTSEIPETLEVALDNLRPKEEAHEDDNSVLAQI
jgi:hypothetical protein